MFGSGSTVRGLHRSGCGTGCWASSSTRSFGPQFLLRLGRRPKPDKVQVEINVYINYVKCRRSCELIEAIRFVFFYGYTNVSQRNFGCYITADKLYV